jgi:hypothetical protein
MRSRDRPLNPADSCQLAWHDGGRKNHEEARRQLPSLHALRSRPIAAKRPSFSSIFSLVQRGPGDMGAAFRFGLAAAVAAAFASILVSQCLVPPGQDSNIDRSKPPPQPIFRAGWHIVNSVPRWYSHLVPPHLYTIQLSSAFFISKSLYVVTRLGVADQLWDPAAQQPKVLPIDQLAARVGANPDRLHRVMRALAGMGVFMQLEQGIYSLILIMCRRMCRLLLWTILQI